MTGINIKIPYKPNDLKRLKIDKETFVELYKNNTSINRIAQVFLCSRPTVRRRILEWKLPKRGIDEQRRIMWHDKRKKAIKRNKNGSFMKGEAYPENYEYRDKVSVTQRAKRERGDKCQICGWNNAPVDGHHIKETSDGGKHMLNNIILVCPNCHRLIHCDKIKLNGKHQDPLLSPRLDSTTT